MSLINRNGKIIPKLYLEKDPRGEKQKIKTLKKSES